MAPVDEKEGSSKCVMKNNFEKIAEKNHQATNIGEYCNENKRNLMSRFVYIIPKQKPMFWILFLPY